MAPRAARPLHPAPAPRASRSRLARVAGLLVLGLSMMATVAQAQIVQEKPGRIRAANRRALREARATESPYKDSHLAITPDRLKRGASNEPRPATSPELDYKTGTAPNVQPPGLLGMRRKTALQRPPAQETKKEKKK